MSRWIKLYDDVLNWRWAHKPEYVSFMVHCLLLANSQPKKWENIEIPRGSFVTTIKNMAERVGISERTFRTIIQHLIECEFLSVKTTNRYTLITICNYESYQERKEVIRQTNDNQTANSRQSNDNQTANSRQSIDNQTTHTLEYTDNIENENKEYKTLSKREESGKKIFSEGEIIETLAKEKIYLNPEGLREFKSLNERPDSKFNYNSGIVDSAKSFLKRHPEYRGKPPQPPQPPRPEQPQPSPPDPATVQLWENVKADLKEQISTKDFNTWIKPITPLKVVGDTLTIIVPSDFFQEYIEDNLITYLQTALNKLNIINLIYTIIKN